MILRRFFKPEVNFSLPLSNFLNVTFSVLVKMLNSSNKPDDTLLLFNLQPKDSGFRSIFC